MSTGDKNLFLTNCVVCHTPSGLENRTASQIQSAIRGNVGGMGTSQLNALSSTSIDGIARTLVPTTPQVILMRHLPLFIAVAVPFADADDRSGDL